MPDQDSQVGSQAASVLLDIPTRSLSEPFDYSIPIGMAGSVEVGCAVLVPFGPRKAVGYVVALHEPSTEFELKPIERLLSVPMFDAAAVGLANWIAEEYIAPISEAIRLFLPPGSVPRAVKTVADGEVSWVLQSPKVGDVTYLEVELVGERLGREDVLRFFDPAVELPAEPVQDRGIGGVVGEVAELVGVVAEGVEFFGRSRRAKHEGLVVG